MCTYALRFNNTLLQTLTYLYSEGQDLNTHPANIHASYFSYKLSKLVSVLVDLLYSQSGWKNATTLITSYNIYVRITIYNTVLVVGHINNRWNWPHNYQYLSKLIKLKIQYSTCLRQ